MSIWKSTPVEEAANANPFRQEPGNQRVTGASANPGKLVDQRDKEAKRAKGSTDFGFTVSEVESHQKFSAKGNRI